jgi:hypothetical protein
MFASRFGVDKPATLYVNGRRLAEPVTRERLDALIDQELAHAKQVAATGSFHDDLLYLEIIKDGLFEPPLKVAQAR